jgi:hypothetical protein
MNDPVAASLAPHVHRLRTEYLEMPGLRLTCIQAQRLCGLDAITCADALQALVDAGFLRRTEGGQYVRLTDGPWTSFGAGPLDGTGFRMAKAQWRTPGDLKVSGYR